MTDVLNPEIEKVETPEAANGRFFIAPDHRPSGLVFSLASNLEAIRATSQSARTALNNQAEDEKERYAKLVTDYSRTSKDPEKLDEFIRVQSLLEEASRFSDASATIQNEGLSLASHLRDTLPIGLHIINSNFYWIGADHKGARQFCGTDDTGEDYIVYGIVPFPKREIGEEARVDHFAQLIIDVEMEIAAQSHS